MTVDTLKRSQEFLMHFCTSLSKFSDDNLSDELLTFIQLPVCGELCAARFLSLAAASFS